MAAFEPGAPVRVGLLVNPRARALRQGDGLQALREVAGPAQVVETASVNEVGEAVGRLVRSGVNVLAIAGGDGALHHALQGLVSGARWPGRLLVLRGGTLNIVGRVLGPAIRPDEALGAFWWRWRGAPLGALPALRVPVLRVTGEGLGERYGFIFGSEMVKNALELYDRFGGGYEGLGKFLFEAGRGYLLHTPLWQQESWRLTPPPFGLDVDDGRGPRQVRAYSAAIACSVDLALGGGAVRALRRRPGDRGFFARVITETRTGPLLRMIPALMREAPVSAVVDVPEATSMRLHGAYTIDGECFGASSRAPQSPRPLRVEAAGEVSFIPTTPA